MTITQRLTIATRLFYGLKVLSIVSDEILIQST